MLNLVLVAALVAVTAADSGGGGGGGLYADGVPSTRLSQQCAGVCRDSGKFKLQPGWTYVYNYEGTATSEIAGSSNETSQIKISAKAHIRVSPRPCELILVVRDVQLLDSDGDSVSLADGQKEFAAQLEQFPLRFSYQDGRVDQLCPSASEATWTLNIKRGMLSMLQNSMSDLSKDGHMYEKDVSGSCDTTYTAAPMMWSDVKVLKFKDLRSCSGKGHQTLGLPASWTSGAKSTPLIKSEQICEQTIRTDNGTYLVNSRCLESHIFAPFSNGESGIRTTAEVSLALDSITQTEEAIPVDLFVNKRTSLQFELSPESSEEPVSDDEVWNVLNQLVAHSQLGVDNNVPQLFDQLVSLLARMDDQQLVKVFDEVRDPKTRGYLVDALPQLGSAGSVWAMHQIYSAGEVTREEVDTWLIALTFQQRPSLQLINKLGLFLLDGYHPRTWLAVGALVHSYCKHDSTCQQRPEVQNILATLEAVLGKSCHTKNREEEEQVIVALKSIGNAGLINSLETLEQCLSKENKNALEVRLAAVSAVRRMSCSQVSRLPLLRVLRDRHEDSELRIAAYLAVLQCPTTAVVSALQDVLRAEDTNQVLSFIWTHLTNIQESNSAWRREIRQMLQDTYLSNKFKTDARKFSRNYEMSAYSDVLNSGVTADSNIIFSTKSYLPRSANLNLTLDLFGETVNIFEVGTRIEGFENVVENIFGPKGLFPDENMQKMLKNMRSTDKEENGVIQSFSESFRKGMNGEPHGTVFVRVLGNELYLSQFSGLGDLMEMKNVKKQSLKYIRESLGSIFTNRNINYSKSFRLVNTEHVLPTILGLPLKLKVNGTASVNMQLKTEVDLDNILKTSSGDIVFSANPSAALNIDGKMIIDATFTQSGVETKGSINSNTYLDTSIKIEKGQVMDVFVNVPREKVEIVNVTSSVYLKKRAGLVEVEGVGEVTERDSCSGDHIPTLSGLRVCSQLVWRNASATDNAPYFPLTGRFRYALALHRSDDFEFYKFHLKQNFKVVSDINTHEVRYYNGDLNIELDTPGSRVNRRVAVDLSYDTREKNAKLALASPAGSVELKGRLTVDAEQTSGVAELGARVNGEDYAAVKLALQTERGTRSIRFEPLFLLQVAPKNVNVNISGHFHIVQGSKYSGDVTAVGLTDKPLQFSGDLSGGKGRYAAALSSVVGTTSVKLNTHVVHTAAVTSCKTLVRYTVPGRPLHSVDFSAKLQTRLWRGFTRRQLTANLQTSEFPQWNTKVGWLLHRADMYVSSVMDLTVGKTVWKSQQLYHNSLRGKDNKFEAILSLECPSKQLDYRAELLYKMSADKIHGHALAQLSESKRFIVRADYADEYPQRVLELEAASPWSQAGLEGRLTVAGDQVLNSTVVARWGPSDNLRWISFTGRYDFAESLLSAINLVEGNINAADWEDPVWFRGVWKASAQDGLIISDCLVTVTVDRLEYSLDVDYVKNPIKGKHDVTVGLSLPHKSYKGNFLIINNQEKKNVTVRLDLEKTLYFTTQLQLWRSLDVQLFWDYLEDKNQSVLIQYKNSPESEVAIVSMPGHYASLTVDKLAPGFTSMNITAMWGESEGSATNAILLSTYWNLNVSSFYSPAFGHVLMPAIEAKIHLLTPFVGFEQQSFILDVNGEESSATNHDSGMTYYVTRKVKVITNWQEQNFDFALTHHAHEGNGTPTDGAAFNDRVRLWQNSETSFTLSINSSLEAFKSVLLYGFAQDIMMRRLSTDGQLPLYKEKLYGLDGSYNNWATLFFRSECNPDEIYAIVQILDQLEDQMFGSRLSIEEGSVRAEFSSSPNKKIVFKSNYHWPDSMVINLKSSFAGFEKLTAQYNFSMDDETIQAKIIGEAGKEFFSFLANLYRSHSKLSGKVEISSSAAVADLGLNVEHQLYKDLLISNLKESFAISLSKSGKILQTAQAHLSFVDHKTSISSRMKRLESFVVFPGHKSSLNYTYQTQVKTSGVEVLHELSQQWNSEETDLSLAYEGLNSLVGVLKRNNDRKAEFSFKKISNSNYKTDLFLSGGYSVKHRLFYLEYPNWENFMAITSPAVGKVIVKNLQTMNSGGTSFVHKSTISLNKEVAYIDFVYNLDLKSKKLQNMMFSTTSPWNHPIIVKYDLIIDTRATSKHEIGLKFKQVEEIKGVLDVTSSENKYSAAFNLYSPYCKDLAGKFNFENDAIKSKGNLVLNANEKKIVAEVELMKTFENPVLSLSVNSSNEKIVEILSTYDIRNLKKDITLKVSYYDMELSFVGYYWLQDSLRLGFDSRTPFIGWNEISLTFDSKLSKRYSMFALNGRKDEDAIILSATGSLMSDTVKGSIAMDYSFTNNSKKHSSALFEYHRGKDSVLISLNGQNNEIKLIDFKINLLKEPENVVNQDSYLFTYTSQTPLEILPDSDVEMRFIKNNKTQKLTGDISINNMKASFKIDNTFDSFGIGHLDLNVRNSKVNVGLLLKHFVGPDLEDSYSVQIFNNMHGGTMYVDGNVSISNNNGLQIKYGIASSADILGEIKGTTVILPGNSSFDLDSYLTVNSDHAHVLYKVTFDPNNMSETKHNLNVSLEVKGSALTFMGDLEYKHIDSELVYVKGEITNGEQILNSIFYSKSSPSLWDVKIVCDKMVNVIAESSTSGLTLSLKVNQTKSIPKFLMNFRLKKYEMMFETDNTVMGKIQVNANLSEITKPLIFGNFNGLRVNGTLNLLKDSVDIEIISNIPEWRKVNVAVRQYAGENERKKYSIDISKENQQVFHLMSEGAFNPHQGNGLLSFTTPKFFVNVDLQYQFSPVYSLDLNYDINGNKHRAGGKVSLSPESARIDLATPIRGFEDLSLSSTIDRRNKKVELVFEKNGKIQTIEISATIDKKRVIFKGFMADGKNEYIVSVGAQNGTTDDPRAMSFYITAFKNKLSVLMISFDGSYDLKTKAGIKFSFSSYFYKQLYLEISSVNEKISHTFIFNYIYGIDIAYSLKSILIKEESKPKLTVESNIGPNTTHLDIWYNLDSATKAVGMQFSANEEMLLNMMGEVALEGLVCKFTLTLENVIVFNALEDLNISAEYNFEKESFVDALVVVNKVKYFDFTLNSSSLYKTSFQSSLTANKFINNSYFISLDYNLVLPDLSVSSYVLINEEYYKSQANLTWDNSFVAVFYQLNTNAGYGFENASMSAQYKAKHLTNYSHFIDFTVDNATLFHISSHILNPNRFLLDVILPDSLFLPFVKEIRVGFSLTQQEKKIKLKYLSDSQEKRKFELDVLMQGTQCTGRMSRSEINEEDVVQMDSFHFAYKLMETIFEVETSLIWENDDLFSLSFHKETMLDPTESEILSKALFYPGNNLEWNFVVLNNNVFEFSGIINRDQVKIVFTHPQTIHHEQLGLVSLAYTSKIEEFETLKVLYSCNETVRSEINIKNPSAFVVNLLKDEESLKLNSNFTLIHKAVIWSSNKEIICEGATFVGSRLNCDVLHYRVYQTGTDKPLSLQIKLNLITSELNGLFKKGETDFNFGGKAVVNKSTPVCSNIQLYYNSTRTPSTPFTFRYETNCLDTFDVVLNVFENKTRSVSLISDFGKQRSNLYIQGHHLYYKYWNISAVFNGINGKTGDITINLEEKHIHVSTLIHPKNSYLKLDSTFEELRKMEINYEENNTNDDIILGKYHGNLKIQGSKINTEWKCDVFNLNNGTVQVSITSENDLRINLLFENSNEFSVKVSRGGNHYEGLGSIKKSTHTTQSKVVLSLDGKQHEFNLEHFSSFEGEVMSSITLKTPLDDYFVKFHIKPTFDSQTFQSRRLMSIEYKTPYPPLDSGDLKVEYSATPVLSQEAFSLEEYFSSASEELYEVSYTEVTLTLALATKKIKIDDASFSVSFGNKYGMNFMFDPVKLTFETSILQNKQSLAGKTVIEIQGVDVSYITGKTILNVYFDNGGNLLGFFQTPSISNVMVTSQSQKFEMNKEEDDTNEDSLISNNKSNRTTLVTYGKETILNLASHISKKDIFSDDNVQSHQYIQVQLNSQWQGTNLLKSYFDTTFKTYLNPIQAVTENQTIHFDVDCKIAQFQSVYSSMETGVKSIKSLDVHVTRSWIGESFNPKILFASEVNENSEIQYNLSFTNGFSNEKYLFKGNCSLKLPNLYSVSNKPSIDADILLESNFAQYESGFKIAFERNKLDALINWRRCVKPIKENEVRQFTSLSFGGEIQTNTVEFYLNDNRFIGSIENSETLTSVSVNLVNPKLNKNITVFASVQYAPMFIMTISHTVFDSPCSIEVKVDRRPLSLESAVIVRYNSLKQQAYVNVYLDGSPRYVEMIYIDIWQQTHEVLGQLEEKSDEVTFKGKINSPSLDENFLVITIGSNNDKVDLNLSDIFIFKAFKDDESLILNVLVFGNDYNLSYKSQDGTNEINVIAPDISGSTTFSLSESLLESFATCEIQIGSYHFVLDLNKVQPVKIWLTNASGNILNTAVEFENGDDAFQLIIQCDILDNANNLNIKNTYDPVLLVMSVGSSLYLKHDLELMLGMKKEDVFSGIFEVKCDRPLFKSYLALSKENRSLEMTAEAPLFSEMDKVNINGVFKYLDTSDIEMKLSGVMSSAGTLVAHISLHLTNNEEVFSTGLIVKNKLNNFNDIELSMHVPLQLSSDMKVSFIMLLPQFKPYELRSSFCISEMKVTSTASLKWETLLYSFDFKYGKTPFYTDSYELNVHYLDQKIQIGAWMKPKYPLTDYIYFLDVDDKRIAQLSHALILQHNHFKSKLIVESAFEGHEKYGVDLELQNLKLGKVVKILGSVPNIGADLGIDFAFSYESLWNYAALAQIRVPYNNMVKTARLTSLQKFQRNMNLTKLNHSLECDGFGAVGWEFEMYGSAPFFWQGDISGLETKLNIINATYITKLKSYLQPDKLQLSCVVEAPLGNFQKGEVALSGTSHLVGSELVLSLNSNELFNASISKDLTNTKQITILSKWRNILLTYLYEIDEGELGANGYVCWDLSKKDTSQFGISFTGKALEKYETTVELLLPSALIPKLGAKATLAYKVSQLFSLIQLDFPGLTIEGKVASDFSPVMSKSGVQLKWTSEDNRSPKDIGIFYVTEANEDELKTHFTLQHFALQNDIVVSTYVRNTVYGMHLQYSPLKEEELTLEFGYWSIEDGEKVGSGVKLTALHPASNTLIYGVANITSTEDFLEGGTSVAYLGKGEHEKIRYIELFGKKNRKLPQAFLGFSSNGNTLGVGGSVWRKDNDLQGITVEAYVNQNDPFRLEIARNIANSGIEAELSYSLSRTYRAYVGMPNSNELTARLSHTVYGKPNTDALATLRLNSSRILWGKFEFPPMTQLGQEFYNGVLDEYTDITLVSQAISDGFLDFAKEDFSEKVLTLINGVSSQSDLLIKETGFEISVVKLDVVQFGNKLHDCYELDHFYLKTCFQHLRQFGLTIQKHISCTVSVVVETASSLLAPVTDIASRVWQVMESALHRGKMLLLDINVNRKSPLTQVSEMVEHYRNLRRTLTQHAKDAVAYLRRTLSQLEHQYAQWATQTELAVNRMVESAQQTVAAQVQRVVDYAQTVVAGFSIFGNTVQEMVDIVRDGIYRIKEVRYTLEWAARVIDYVNSWFSDIRLGKYLQQLDMFCKKVVQLVVSDVEKNFGEYEVYLIRAQQFVTGQYEELSKIPQVHYIRSVINNVYQKAKWLWHYTRMSERLREAAKRHIENILETLDDIENRLDREEDVRMQYEYNEENNSLTFTQELPFKWRAFNTLPEYSSDNRAPSIPAQEYSNMVQTIGQYLWQDAKLLPYLLPPLGADAILSRRNVVTFDNSFYEMPDVCGKYLLSADLHHQTFSLILHMDGEKRDLILTTQNMEVLVKENFEVYINGKLEDLPMTLNSGGKINVERRPNSVYVSSTEGFSLECSSYQEQCRFHLDGWYTGKVAGLFGTYNNEPLDDLIGPDWSLTASVEEFVKQWMIEATSCELQTQDEQSEEETPSYESMCELFFSSQSSPFYPCFHVVDPKAFYNMCLKNARKGNTCGSVFAYLTKCTSSGVQLWMPEFCVAETYSAGSISLSLIDSPVVTSSMMSADVVWVVEEGDCIRKDTFNFSDVPSTLDMELKAKGMADNRFAFVSFNKKDAQIQTVHGQIWTEDVKNIADVVSRLTTSSEPSSAYASALDLATSLPFRPGAAKMAVLIHCSSCPVDQSHSSILERLSQQDMSLHILQENTISGKRGREGKAIGLEKAGAYPRKWMGKNASPNAALLEQVSVPQDLCTPLALGTNGTLFNMDVINKGLKAWGGRVAAGAVPPTSTSLCEKTLAPDNVPVMKCHWASDRRKLKEWDHKALEEYLDVSKAGEIYTEYEEIDR